MFGNNSTKGGLSEDERRRRHVRQVYGLDGYKSHYKQKSSDSCSIRLVLVGLLLAVLIGLAVLGLEAFR